MELRDIRWLRVSRTQMSGGGLHYMQSRSLLLSSNIQRELEEISTSHQDTLALQRFNWAAFLMFWASRFAFDIPGTTEKFTCLPQRHTAHLGLHIGLSTIITAPAFSDEATMLYFLNTKNKNVTKTLPYYL